MEVWEFSDYCFRDPEPPYAAKLLCTTNAPLTVDQNVEALQRYFTNHDRWRSEFSWAKKDLGPRAAQANLGAATILPVLGLAIAGIVISWFLFAI